MKKYFFLLMCVAIVLSFAACSTVDLNTPKSAELKEQYNFYEKSVANIRTGMNLTPEQSDEVFIVLVSVGATSEIYSVRKVTDKDNTYTLSWSGSVGSREVDIVNGVVAEIRNGSNVLYPPERSTEYLNAQEVEVVTALIDELNADSSRSDYEAAQSAYDSLSKNLKKEIPENLVNKLSDFNLSTMTIETAVDSAIEAARAEKDRVSINDDLGTGSGKIVLIYLKGADNFTKDAIRNGMYSEARDILKSLQKREDISEITMFWSFPLVDSYGNTKEDTVMKVNFNKTTLDKINFENFDYNKIPDIADDYFEHAALSN